MVWKLRIYMEMMGHKRGCKDFKRGLIKMDRSREIRKET